MRIAILILSVEVFCHGHGYSLMHTSAEITKMLSHTLKNNNFSCDYDFSSTKKPVEEACTLPPEIYRLPNFHQVELDKIFGHAWVCVGYTEEVNQPGKILRAHIGGQALIITRNKEGQLRGFFNVCRHRGSLLVVDDRKHERFRCPYHSWTYDLDGKLLNCPLFNLSEQSFSKEDHHLLPVRVASYGCFIFVCLSEKTESLSDYLGDFIEHYGNFPLAELVSVKRKDYVIKSNWKLVAENFLEYYHLPWVHPELCEVTPIDMHKRNQGSGMYMSFYASPLGRSDQVSSISQLSPMPGLNKTEADSGYFPFVFPNLATFLLPNHLFSLLMQPSKIDETKERADLLVHPSIFNHSDARQKIEEIFAFYDMVNLQDVQAVERVQEGIMAKTYQGGRMSYHFEEPVHRFQNMVIDFLEGKRRRYLKDEEIVNGS